MDKQECILFSIGELRSLFVEVVMQLELYTVTLYRQGDVELILTQRCENRHVMEEIARKYIEQGLADSMGAIGVLSEA